MNITCTWHEKMNFSGESNGHKVEMDSRAPLGTDSALTPKQLLLAAICGCTGMDVVALMKKYKQSVDALSIEASADLTEGRHPAIFKSVHLVFKVAGAVDASRLKEAVELSQTKFCGVTAMVSKAVPIHYDIQLNGTIIGQGHAQFDF